MAKLPHSTCQSRPALCFPLPGDRDAPWKETFQPPETHTDVKIFLNTAKGSHLKMIPYVLVNYIAFLVYK